MRLLTALLALLLLASCVLCASPPSQARVTKVIDGDTIEIAGGFKVRYIGINTPEVYPQREWYGLEAWRKNEELVGGKVVRLEKDVSERDRYGRLLRYVYVDGLFVNAELVRQGYARAKAYPPDTKYQELLERLEAQARAAGRGLWKRR